MTFLACFKCSLLHSPLHFIWKTENQHDLKAVFCSIQKQKQPTLGQCAVQGCGWDQAKDQRTQVTCFLQPYSHLVTTWRDHRMETTRGQSQQFIRSRLRSTPELVRPWIHIGWLALLALYGPMAPRLHGSNNNWRTKHNSWNPAHSTQSYSRQ